MRYFKIKKGERGKYHILRDGTIIETYDHDYEALAMLEHLAMLDNDLIEEITIYARRKM